MDELDVRRNYFTTYEPRPDEYINEDFELICRICGGKRYFGNKQFVVPTLCECQSKILNDKLKLKKERERIEEFKRLQDVSLIGTRYLNVSFNSLDYDRPLDFLNAVQRCKKYCKNWLTISQQGLGIYIYGDTGVGKTVLTACIRNYLIEKFVPVLFTSFIKISEKLRQIYASGGNEEAFITQLSKIDLLIIDDVGTELVSKNGESSWMQEKIYDIINGRYINRKSTIFSSNSSLVDLVNECGYNKKTVDRMASLSTVKIELHGASYRLNEQNNTNLF